MYIVNVKVLNELSKIAPKDDVRYYLNGVYVDIQVDHVYYVVTNGHYAVIYRDEVKDNAHDGLEPIQMIMPADILKKLKADKYTDLWPMQKTGDQWQIMDSIFKPVDATYPDYTKILPKPDAVSAKNPGQQFNTEYLHKINACYQKITGRKLRFLKVLYNCNNESPALLVGDSFTAVIMPMRHEDNINLPDWYVDLTSHKQDKAA